LTFLTACSKGIPYGTARNPCLPQAGSILLFVYSFKLVNPAKAGNTLRVQFKNTKIFCFGFTKLKYN
jgi:hypothetical protein